MDMAMLKGGKIVGLLGLILMVSSITLRLVGHFTIGGIGIGTIFLFSIGAVSASCFIQLCFLTAGRR